MNPPDFQGTLKVKNLRAFLNFVEETWTQEDVDEAGLFEDQEVIVYIPGRGYTKTYLTHNGQEFVLLPE